MRPTVLDQSAFWRVTKRPRTDKNGKNGAMIIRVECREPGKRWIHVATVDCFTNHIDEHPELAVHVSIPHARRPIGPIKQMGGMMDDAPDYMTATGVWSRAFESVDDDGHIGTAVYLK